MVSEDPFQRVPARDRDSGRAGCRRCERQSAEIAGLKEALRQALDRLETQDTLLAGIATTAPPQARIYSNGEGDPS